MAPATPERADTTFPDWLSESHNDLCEGILLPPDDADDADYLDWLKAHSGSRNEDNEEFHQNQDREEIFDNWDWDRDLPHNDNLTNELTPHAGTEITRPAP